MNNTHKKRARILSLEGLGLENWGIPFLPLQDGVVTSTSWWASETLAFMELDDLNS